MTEQTGLIVNALTGQEAIVPLTQQELDFVERVENEQKALEQEQQARVAARESALAKLAALGLTEAEIAAL